MTEALEQAVSEVISILPITPDALESEISVMTPRVNETYSGITEYLEWLGFKVQEIFEQNGLNLSGDDPDISEFRHMLKNLSVRTNQPENSMNKNGEKTYKWIDIFRSNLKYLIDNPSE